MLNRRFAHRVNPLAAEFASMAVRARHAVPQSLTTQVATRANISPWLAIYDALPNPDPVLRKTSNRIEILDEIKREPHVSACSKSRKAGVIRRLWTIDKKDATPAATELVEKIFQNLELESITREMLDGWGYGYKPLEIIWKRDGNLYVPAEIIGKPPSWFCFGQENDLRLKRKNDINSDPVEPNKFLLTRYEASYDNPYGEAQYSLAFWPTTFKRGGIKHWAVSLDSFSMPHAIGKLPRGASKTDIEKLLEVLNGLVRDAAGVIPDDASVELLETKWAGSSGGVFETHSRYHDGEISKCILGHASAADATPGKLGGDDPAMNVRSDIIEDDSRMVMAAYNHLIKYIFDLNPGLGDYRPQFKLYDENDVDTSRADRDFKLMNSGSVVISQEYFERCYDFRPGEITVQTPGRASQSPAPAPEFSAPAVQARQAVPSSPNTDTAQDDVDTMLTAITEADMRTQLETLMAPVINLVEMSSSYEELNAGIIKLYPHLDATGIQSTIEKAMLLANIRGNSDSVGAQHAVPPSPEGA